MFFLSMELYFGCVNIIIMQTTHSEKTQKKNSFRFDSTLMIIIMIYIDIYLLFYIHNMLFVSIDTYGLCIYLLSYDNRKKRVYYIYIYCVSTIYQVFYIDKKYLIRKRVAIDQTKQYNDNNDQQLFCMQRIQNRSFVKESIIIIKKQSLNENH